MDITILSNLSKTASDTYNFTFIEEKIEYWFNGKETNILFYNKIKFIMINIFELESVLLRNSKAEIFDM